MRAALPILLLGLCVLAWGLPALDHLAGGLNHAVSLGELAAEFGWRLPRELGDLDAGSTALAVGFGIALFEVMTPHR